jgi:type VI secretion system VasD/TssJ family lipoprotein
VKKHFEVLCPLLLMFLVYSCVSRPIAPAEWRYEKEAIHVSLSADPLLNLYDGAPHTLHICVHQLKDPNAFLQLADDEEGLYSLLECSRFDASVISHKSLSIQPGQDATFVLDRAQGAKYVTVVAGYYWLQKEGMMRLFDVPVIIEKKGLIRRTKTAKPGPLNIELTLGPQQIRKTEKGVHKVRRK